MDSRSSMRDFLASRRARVDPEQVGFPGGGNRRVPGLRREELAALAGVSVSYYTRLERGDAVGVSDSVLDAIARTLRLDDVERAHLFDLARVSAASTQPLRRGQSMRRVRPALQQMIDGMPNTPVIVQNTRADLVAANPLAKALFSDLFDRAEQPNHARYIHLDPRAQTFYRDWDAMAGYAVAMLRVAAGQRPYDRDLTDLIGELVTRSDDFRTRWAAHHVHEHKAGVKAVHHPVVGDLDLAYESMQLAADEGLRMTMYSAEPGSASEDGLRLLGTWAATSRLPAAAGRPTTGADAD